MRKFLFFVRKPLVWLALTGSVLGSVLSDAEVTTSRPSQDTPVETLGLLLIVTAGIVLTIQIWRLWLRGKFLEKSKTMLRQVGGISLSAVLAISVVGVVGVQGQSIRLAIDGEEKSRYEASVKLAAAEQKEVNDKKAAAADDLAIAEAQKKSAAEDEKKKAAEAKNAEKKAEEEAKAQVKIDEANKLAQAEAEKANAFKDSKNIKNGGFTDKQIKTMALFSKLMYSYVDAYAGYVVGNATIATVQFGCAKLEESYPIVNQVSSASPYYEDLLDRAKDYYYEAKSTCSHAFKKNRIDEIQESATYAATAKGFFDRILKEIKK